MMMDPNALAQAFLQHFFDTTNRGGHHHLHHHHHHHHHHDFPNSIFSFFHRPHNNHTHHTHNTLFSKLIPSLPFQQQPTRWSFLDVGDNSIEDCCGLVMAAGKSGNSGMIEPLKHPTAKKRKRDQSRGKSPGRSSMTEVMEQKIWKDLPEDLLEAVIARLPIATFFRFRSVCWRWNSLLTSQSFSQHFAQVQQANTWFFTTTHGSQNSGAMYDPSMKKWYHQTVSALPTKLPLFPVASAGGLVCFIDYLNRSFYVCNPLTQSFKELPARSQSLTRVAVGMTANQNSPGAGYKILWVSFNGQYEIYDSIKMSWSSPGNMPAGLVPLTLELRSHSVSVDSTVYFMHSFPWEGILSYDMETGVWKEYIIPKPSMDLIDYTLAECDGRIMFVGLLKKNAAACVCIWELQKMTLLWKEVDRMPNVWCLDLYGKHVTMTCLGNKGLLMLSLRSKQMNRLVTYDMASREWLKVPGCVMPRGRKRRVLYGIYGTAFHPCPTAVA